MQEVFEKIIEKLEERTSFISECTKYGNKDAEQQNKSYSTMMMYEAADLVDDLIEIVKQAAAEYNESLMKELLEAKKHCGEDSDCSECIFGQVYDRCYLQELQIRNNNGWIPCSERLPEVEINPVTNDYVRYNATYKNGDVSDVRCYAYGEASGGKHWLNSGQIMDEYVIAWQPLPEPYNQKFIQECANPVSQEEREELNKKIRSIPVCTYQTNADRIRAMNDEELAGSRIDRIDFYTKSDNPEYIGDFEGIANSIEEANKLEIAWLQSEVEE